MPNPTPYQQAEQKIQQALQSGATELDLPHVFICDQFLEGIKSKGGNYGSE